MHRSIRSAIKVTRNVNRSRFPSAVIGSSRAMTTSMIHATKNTSRNVAFAACGVVAIGSAAYFAADAKSGVDIAAVKEAILDIYESNNDLGPFFVRLAWHASGTYCKTTKNGGSGGGATMRFDPEINHGANAGLSKAQAALEPVKKKFPDLSYADLWTLAAVTVIEEMGGPTIGWQSGRVDKTSGIHCTPNGRLPDADLGTPDATIKHIRSIFYRMGFNDQEIVALAGAHALGRCHTNYSGYDGPWTRAPTTFSNEYFRLLLDENWHIRNWDGPSQWENDDEDLMMLHSDMAFIWDKEFKKYVKMYADDEELFFKDFASAFQKLEELGCSFPASTSGGSDKPWWKFW
jgi:cytochrome c peroxidase